MIKLLIISYHYPPDNIIAARRSEAYAKHFHKFGIYPTIITDRFEKIFDEKGKWIGIKNHLKNHKHIVEEHEKHKVIRLPRVVAPIQKLQLLIQRIPLISPSFTFIMNVLGHFEMHLLGHYYNYRDFLTAHLKHEKYDMILAIDSPHYHVRLASYINKKFKMPVVCDFRDLYDNFLLHKGYRPPIKILLMNYFKRKYMKQWLLKSTFVTAASEPWAQFYSDLSGKPGFEITNGYEPFEKSEESKDNANQFIVTHTGRLFSNQDWSIFAEGIKLFIEKQKPERFKVIFAGVRKDAENIIRKILHYIPNKYIDTYGWLEKSQIVKIQKNTSVFIGSYLKGTIGHYPGKIFEYLGVRKPVLFAPGGNDDVVDKMLEKTKAGYIANTPEEVCWFITQKYNEWVEFGKVKYSGIEDEVLKYSRENQVKKLSDLIKVFLVVD